MIYSLWPSRSSSLCSRLSRRRWWPLLWPPQGFSLLRYSSQALRQSGLLPQRLRVSLSHRFSSLLRVSHSWRHSTRFHRVPSLLALSSCLGSHLCALVLQLSQRQRHSLCWIHRQASTSVSLTVLWLVTLRLHPCRLLQLLRSQLPPLSTCRCQ